MRRFLSFLGLALLVVAGCNEGEMFPTQAASDDLLPGKAPARGRVAVANRASGTISVIDAKTDELVGTYDLPAEMGDPQPEPMYVVHTTQMGRVFVGDRANDRVAVFDAHDFSVVGTVPAGSGIFHMWADSRGKQLWVNNDIDNTTTVIDPKTLQVITTVSTPADLVAMGGKPHDVIVGPRGEYAYVSVLGLPGANDYVVQFSTATFMEIGRAAVGKDPHLALFRQSPWLFVACQNSDVVVVLDRLTLAEQTQIAVPGAHGAGMPMNGRYFYTTNLPGGGMDGIFTIDTKDLSVVGSMVNAPYAVPHNIALTPNGRKLFVTHSGGAADKVTIYTLSGNDPTPAYAGEVTVGLNPFGLAYIR